MSERFYVVVGQTAPVDVQLFRDNLVVDLTGATVTLVLTGKNGVTVDATGDVEILDAATGKARYNPDADDFDSTLSPYVGRWRVQDSGGKVAFYPNRDLDQWIVGA